MPDVDLNEDSRILFHTLSHRREGTEYFIGRDDIGSYIAIPEVGFRAIELLRQGATLARCKLELEKEIHEEVEIEPFIRDLIKAGFVRSVDGVELEDAYKKKRYWFTGVRQEHARLLFSGPALYLYAFVILFGLIIMLANPKYVPGYRDIFFHERYTVVLMVSFLLSWILVFKHEMSHLFAGKAQGIQGRFSISNRLHYIVAETDLTQLWQVPPENRYLPYLAGMISDLFLAALFIIFLWVSDVGVLSLGPLVYGILQMIILVELLGVLWQFEFFMRTDVYYVVANYFGCKNLMGDAKSLIKNRMARFSKKVKSVDMSNIPEREMRVIRAYSVLFFFGTAIVLSMFVFIGLPITFQIYGDSISNLMGGYEGHEGAFIDGLVVMILTTFEFTLLGAAIWLKRRKKRLENRA